MAASPGWPDQALPSLEAGGSDSGGARHSQARRQKGGLLESLDVWVELGSPVGVGLSEGVGDGDSDGVVVGDSVGESDGVGVGESLGLSPGVGVPESLGDGLSDGVPLSLGLSLGWSLGVGSTVGPGPVVCEGADSVGVGLVEEPVPFEASEASSCFPSSSGALGSLGACEVVGPLLLEDVAFEVGEEVGPLLELADPPAPPPPPEDAYPSRLGCGPADGVGVGEDKPSCRTTTVSVDLVMPGPSRTSTVAT